MLELHILTTPETRKYTTSLSSFDARKFNDQVDVVFVHKNGDGQERAIHWEPRARVVSVDLPIQEYQALWTKLWTQRVPTLRLKIESSTRFDFDAVDSARVTQPGECS